MAASFEEDVRKRLEAGIRQLDQHAQSWHLDLLQTYIALLEKWNRAFNLSGIRDPLQMVDLHVLDSLSISPYLRGSRVLDIGSGAGLPGVPLAIFHPDKEFILLDSNSKKTRFLFQVKLALKLDNLTIENRRLEHYQCSEQIDIVTCRAVGALDQLVEQAASATSGQGVLLAMKGAYPEAELKRLPPGFVPSREIELNVPGTDAARYLIEIPLHRAGSTHHVQP